MSERFLALIDDTGARDRLGQLLGAENVVCLSRLELGHGVLRISRSLRRAVIAECERLHATRPFAGVIHWHEQYVILAHVLAERLGLPLHIADPWPARDKLAMRRALKGLVGSPDSVLLRAADDPRAMPLPPFPCVLKPRFGFNSICARRVDDRQELVRELREKRDKLRTTRLWEVDLEIPSTPDFLCEPFVAGTEHSVESLVSDGRVRLQILSDKLPMRPPYFVEAGDVMPSCLSAAERDAVLAAARAAIAALDIRFGWTHTEIKLDRGQPVVMEVAARMGGGYTRDLVREVYGIDMLGLLVDVHRQRFQVPELQPEQAIVANRLLCKNIGLVWGIEELESIRNLPHVRLLEAQSASRLRGIFLGVPYSYGGTLLTYFVSGRTPAQAASRAADVSARLRVRGVEWRLPAAWYGAYLRLKDQAQAHLRSVR